MEQRLIAVSRRRANAFSFGRFAPVGGGCDSTVVSGEADQHSLTAVFLTRQLADIQLAALAHLRRACVAEVGIMLPDRNLRPAGFPTEIRGQFVSVSAMWRSRRFHDDVSSRNMER